MLKKLKKTLTTCLCAAACGLSLAAQAPVTLASWTFETGYTVTALDGGNSLYTPNGGSPEDTGAVWYNTGTINVLPENCAGDASAYVLRSFSEGRYHQLCTGWETRVYRIENNVENPTADYTNPANHKAYYQVSFPTTGYKEISLTYAIAPGNNTQTPIEIVVSTDGGQTWIDAGASTSTSAVWFQYADATVDLSVNNKDNVLVRLLPTSGTTNWNLRNLSISGSEMEKAASADNENVTFTWTMGSTTPATTATASNSKVFSVYNMTVGSGLTATREATISGGSNQTLYKPSSNNSSEYKTEDAITLAVTPKKGITFLPTSIAFQAQARHRRRQTRP